MAGDRIAKVLSRAGVASRRAAEAMIAAGRVAVNGRIITSAALNVTPDDRISVDGRPVAAPEPPRIWLYHKPIGRVTTTSDEKGRPTIYDDLPEDLPRVMTIGRLDLNSEGLLLLTNDGGVKRRLELPATGWLRRYRVRLNGRPADSDFEPLRKGLTVDGERFQPMTVTLDRQQGANAWVTVALREGRNREIRRAMEAIGLPVNRLIRTSYGPFQLGALAAGAVEEVRRKVVRDQLGLDPDPVDASPPASSAKPRRPAPSKARRGSGERAGPSARPKSAPAPGVKARGGTRAGTPSTPAARSGKAQAPKPASRSKGGPTGAAARASSGSRPGAQAVRQAGPGPARGGKDRARPSAADGPRSGLQGKPRTATPGGKPGARSAAATGPTGRARPAQKGSPTDGPPRKSRGGAAQPRRNPAQPRTGRPKRDG